MSEVILEERERLSDARHSTETNRAPLLQRVLTLAEELAHRPKLALQAAPMREIERCAEIGLLTVTLPI